MVGTDRFSLSMQGGGRDSVDGDWALVSSFPTFEEGFAVLADCAVTCGWGLWELLSIDRDERMATFRVTNAWEALYQRKLGVAWGTSMIAGKFAGLCSRLFGVNCWTTQTKFQASGDDCDEFTIKRSDLTIEDQLEQLLESDQATRADLAVALEKLRLEIAERERFEQERIALIEALSAPTLQVWDGVLALPILGALSNERANQLLEHLLEEITRSQAEYAILDVTGVDVVDTGTADSLLRVARAVKLLGATCIVTGIRPAVAQTMVGLDSGFDNLVTLATLRDGIKFCMSRKRG